MWRFHVSIHLKMETQQMIGSDDTEDVALNFGEEDEVKKPIRHPIAVFFHVAFRAAAVFVYLFCELFSASFIANFVVVIFFLSVDFWAVKNVTGRLLVGLRWWNHVDEDGKSHWIFESRKGSAKQVQQYPMETRIFWLALVICPLFWIVFFFASLFKINFRWFMVVCVGIAMNGANLYGYIRCKIGAKKPLTSVMSSFLGQQVLKSMFSSATTNPPSQH